MLRNTFLTLSQSEKLRQLATGFAPARMISRRFVAGEQLREAIQVIHDLKKEGLLATLDYLGENTDSEAEAHGYTEELIRALDATAQAGVQPNISLKLTAMGLDISSDLASRNLRRVLQCGKQYQDSFVRIDMESSDYIDRTLDIYWQMRDEGFDNMGVVIQSYLYRSEQDVLNLIERGARVRLVKGAYDEPPHLAYPDKADVDANFVHLMKLLLSEEARAKRHLRRHRLARPQHDSGDQGVCCRARHPPRALRVPDALRHRHLHAPRLGARGLSLPRLCPLWRVLVPLLHAPPCRAPRQRLLHPEKRLPPLR